jgi:hypothetical protein
MEVLYQESSFAGSSLKAEIKTAIEKRGTDPD